MERTYFNFSTNLYNESTTPPWDSWAVGRFIHNWWRIYAGDPQWVPPSFRLLRTHLRQSQNPHLARMQPILMGLEAMAGRKRSTTGSTTATGMAMGALGGGALFDQPVAAALGLIDPRRQDATGYLALLHVINSRQCLNQLTTQITEPLAAKGVQKLIGPTGISPYLGSGVLMDAFNRTPPLHTAYNPPYLPEIMGSVWRPLTRTRLHCAQVADLPAAPALPPALADRVMLAPLHPQRLAADLLPLFQAGAVAWRDVPPPDQMEAEFLIGWLSRWPLMGQLLVVDGESAGFILLQPDMGPVVRRARGGRPLWGRGWLRVRPARPVQAGRLLFGALLPAHRGQGLGRFLWEAAMQLARTQGWQSVSVGPIPAVSSVSDRLTRWGALPCATYMIHQLEL